ncbi:hypothetical protein Tco_0922168 [Tanacetum coccineum]|uniref:Uncharacterized protein n=1 Tax=Tanacetum coccineum TaxID=301880 RepID=A0ABQ5D4J9_9ASTR
MNTPKDGFDIVHGKTGNGGTKPESVEGADVAIPLAAVDEVVAVTQELDDGFMEVTRKHRKENKMISLDTLMVSG